MAAFGMSTAFAAIKLMNYKPIVVNTEMISSKQNEQHRLNQMFDVISDEVTIYHFYNSANPLHEDFNRTLAGSFKQHAHKANAKV